MPFDKQTTERNDGDKHSVCTAHSDVTLPAFSIAAQEAKLNALASADGPDLKTTTLSICDLELSPQPARTFNTFTVVGKLDGLMPDHPTALFLDRFDKSGIFPNQWMADPIVHGEVSASPAEQRGYNVIRLSEKPFTDFSDNTPKRLSSVLEEVATNIENGTLPLGEGDVLNISLAGPRFHSYDETNRTLGLHITAENLREETPHIIEAMERYTSKTNSDDPSRQAADDAVRMYKAIQRIQRRGVEVIHAAGNTIGESGADVFDWKFLGAKTELTATNAAGEIYDWSVHNSRTTPELGDYELKYEPATPFTLQTGRYKLGNLPVYFDASLYGGAPHSPTFKMMEDGSPSGFGGPPYPANFESVGGRYPFAKYDIDIAHGSSFANINYLWKRYDFYRDLKIHRSAP
jgi:hypothetical protein